MDNNLKKLREWHKNGCACTCKNHMHAVRALLDIAESAQGLIDTTEDATRMKVALDALYAIDL